MINSKNQEFYTAMKKTILIFISLLNCYSLILSNNLFSTAGFYNHDNQYRKMFDFNVGWRFYKGDVKNAMNRDFNDSGWELVSLPHSIELLPQNASGGRNYQGIVWYRKHFKLNESFVGQKTWLHFEAIMGKCKIYINGELIKEHFGGFLPVIIDLSATKISLTENNVISICADNSNDPSYPPGKSQETMDFCYFGGVYRDCWLYTTPLIHISDANYVDKQAGGGVFVSYENVSENEATVRIQTDIVNDGNLNKNIKLLTHLVDESGRKITAESNKVLLKSGENKTITQMVKITKPKLWHPDSPNLYSLVSEVMVDKKIIDGIINNIGIRSIEFRANQGLFINGKHFTEKLLGTNRHQDFGYIGMALSNSLHFADVLKLRNAGFRIIRSAHYPQDPAFMDACDRLGMFVIVATPGWQFWNDDPIFENRVLSDVKNMIRRDRNHPSVLLWEPILNETHFPIEFARKAFETVHSEYPFRGCFAAIDDRSKGNELYDVIYCAPQQEEYYSQLGKCCFTREFGDCVDDWYSHNSYSRVANDWSEQGLLHQAQHYAKKDYEGSLTVDQLNQAPAAHVGGTLWHSFDHQRGYHPDPFYGGIMNAFRQPKYSYYMFQGLRNPNLNLSFADSGPFIHIAHAMTPISPENVTIYSNCDSVRLIITADNKVQEKQTADAFILESPPIERFFTDTITKPVIKNSIGIPSEPVVFKNAFSFVTIRALHRGRLEDKATIIAEGIVDGRVVITDKKMPSKRSDKIKLSIDNSGIEPQANGSDIILVTASITDKRGYIRRLAKERILFSIEGEGSIIGDETIGANPCIVEGGVAPLLVRTTTKSGTVKVIAKLEFDGINTATSDTLIFNTIPSKEKLNYTEVLKTNSRKITYKQTNTLNQIDKQEKLLEQVQEDQEYFEATENGNKSFMKKP